MKEQQHWKTVIRHIRLCMLKWVYNTHSQILSHYLIRKKKQLSCIQNIGFDFKRSFQPFLQIIFWSWNTNKPMQASCSELKLVWCSKIAKMCNIEISVDQPHFTPLHTNEHYSEKSHPLPTILYDSRMQNDFKEELGIGLDLPSFLQWRAAGNEQFKIWK